MRWRATVIPWRAGTTGLVQCRRMCLDHIMSGSYHCSCLDHIMSAHVWTISCLLMSGPYHVCSCLDHIMSGPTCMTE
jgi:hypothetical protein